MAIPSGSGTEVLKRVTLNSTSNTEAALINGVANHIYTVLSITFCEGSGAAEQVAAWIEPSAGGISSAVHIFRSQDVPAYGTFVWNDKFVITGTDVLNIICASAADMDVTCSFVDQDWT